MCQNPAEVYVKTFQTPDDGRPLYFPEPADNLPVAVKNKGFDIGDVTTFDGKGGLDFLFNITHEANHPINENGVPDGFKHIELEKKHIRKRENAYPPRSHMARSSDRSRNFSLQASYKEHPNVPIGFTACFSFSATSQRGAVLVLPKGADSYDLLTKDIFLEHALENAPRWYDYVNNTCGFRIPPDGLYLITGCDKAEEWALAAYSAVEREANISLSLMVKGGVEGSASSTYHWETDHSAFGRVSRNTSGFKNQCVFVRGFTVSIRERLLSPLSVTVRVHDPNTGWSKRTLKLTGEKGPTGSPSARFRDRFSCGSSTNQQANNEREGKAAPEPATSTILSSHPAVAVNKHLLAMHPGANISVTHNHICCPPLDKVDMMLDTNGELVRWILNKFNPVVVSDCVFLLPKVPSFGAGFSVARSVNAYGIDCSGMDECEASGPHIARS